ncbi:MAG: HigA family addiction module antidote protein [Prevotella sp.]|nr:HigA family addiction module antidote protein [Prevotella sp.]MBR1462816.1 HigA family addiction module antidote protein [Prevotella sp.]
MATIKETFVPVEAIHPTELIKDELKARGMQRKELAERLGMKAPNLSRFFNAKESITPSMALKLEEAFGISADYWMGLQLSYERDMEAIRQRDEEEAKAIQVENALAAALNLSILFKKLALDGCKYFRDKLNILYKIFNVENVEGVLALSTAQGQGRFKKSERLETEFKNLSTWILLARYACSKEIDTLTSYEKGNETKAAKEIAAKANAQTITEREIKAILTKYGIGYCVVEKFEKTPVDAYSVIIDGHPFIVVSHRRNNMDMLVFDVLHECGHISKHLVDGSSFVSYNQDLGDAEGVEQEANNYAKDMLIPPSVWANIMKGKSRSLTIYSLIKTVTDEAKKNGISPTIAAWRFKYETGVYQIPGYKSLPIR